MSLDADRSHAWSAATVRNAKRLMQIQVRNIAPVVAGAREANLRVEIGAVDIHLAASRVHKLTKFANPFFKDAMGGWVSHHDGRKYIRELVYLGLEIVEIARCPRSRTER